MELIEIRIKRNTYEATIDGIAPGMLGGVATFRTTETGTPSVVMVALSSQQIDDVLKVLATGTEEAATRMMAGITAGGIRAANDLQEQAQSRDAGLDKLERAAADAAARGA